MDFIVLEPWALAAESLNNPEQRLEFWDALSAYAVHGKEPEPSDGIGIMAVAMARRIIDKHRSKSSAGRDGGIKSGNARSKREANAKQNEANEESDEANAKQTRSKREANAKQTRSKREANAKQNEANEESDEANAKQNEQEREREEKERIESSSTRETQTPTIEQVLFESDTYNWLQYLPGWSRDQMRATVTEVYGDLSANGWLDADGHAIKNWRAYLRKAVSEKKISIAHARSGEVPIFRFDPEAI